jgi:tripartite-type tricarboxylate transporter receptor subunit TctC
VPYKGAQAALTDVLGGQVDMMITGYSTAGPHVKSGRIRVLARTSGERSALTPEIPTIAESGYPGFEVLTWYGLVAPSGTPRPVVDFIHRAVAKALASPDIREKIEGFYAEAVGNSPEEFARVIREDNSKWSGVLQRAKIQLD